MDKSTKRANRPIANGATDLGLYGIFSRMGATRNWRRISDEPWPFVDAPPSTELGRQEAEWLSARASLPVG